jgi:hypothetical protein
MSISLAQGFDKDSLELTSCSPYSPHFDIDNNEISVSNDSVVCLLCVKLLLSVDVEATENKLNSLLLFGNF